MYYKIEQLKNILANHKNCVFSLDHLCSSALEYIQQLESAQPKWISVEERLPGEFVDVLLYGDSRGIAIGSYDANDGYFWKREDENTLRSVNATHWMPLPSAPKEEV